MAITRTIPIETLDALGLHEGDTLRVLGVVESSFLVSITREEPNVTKGAASEWLKSARGAVKLADGESADDARMGYYTEKYRLG